MRYAREIPTVLFLVYLLVLTPKVTGASNDLHVHAREHLLALHESTSVADALPEIQTLWPDHPQAYAQCVKHALDVLARTPTNEVTTQALRRLFSNVVGGTISSNHEEAASLMRIKCTTIMQFMNASAIKNDILTWIDIASIVGDVRSQIVPDYVKQGQLNPANVMHASSLAEARLAVAENRLRVAVDRFQQELRVTDRKLAMLLLNSGREVVSQLSEPQRGHVIGRIVSLARLREDESRQFK